MVAPTTKPVDDPTPKPTVTPTRKPSLTLHQHRSIGTRATSTRPSRDDASRGRRRPVSPSYSYSDLLSHDAVGRSRSRRLVPERREAAAPLRPRRTHPTHRDQFLRRPAVPPSFPSNGRVGSGDDGPAVRTGGCRRRRFRRRRRRRRICDDRRTPAASSPTKAGRLPRPWRGGLDKAQHLSP